MCRFRLALTFPLQRDCFCDRSLQQPEFDLAESDGADEGEELAVSHSAPGDIGIGHQLVSYLCRGDYRAEFPLQTEPLNGCPGNLYACCTATRLGVNEESKLEDRFPKKDKNEKCIL